MIAQSVTEDFIHFTFNGAGGIPQYMLESFVFTMQVGQEMFGTFG